MISNLKINKIKIHLLLGNGFSMAYDPKIFSYNAFNLYIKGMGNELLSKLFEIVNTKNFELIMRQLDNFCEIAKIFGNGYENELVKRIQEASYCLKIGLISSVKELHPQHVFEIPEKNICACSMFLKDYLESQGSIFTTNFDILLYWVLLRGEIDHISDGFSQINHELRWGKYKDSQNVFYLHGALHIFDDGIEIIKEKYDEENYLLEKIEKRIENKQYPVFVTAGYGNDKLSQIFHNHYLSFCYDTLSSIDGYIVTFGFNFSDYDDHIIKAINSATKNGKLQGIFIGIYSEDDDTHIKQIETNFVCPIYKYDASTANIWGK